MANRKDMIARVFTAVHEALYRASGGRLGGRVSRMPVLLLTTTGRKTGRSRTTPLTYFEDGDRVIIVASYGGDDRHPAWYLNLTANPQVTVTRGARASGMTARTATAAEKAEWWPRITSTYQGYADYQKRTTRDIPLVILSPT